MVATNEDFESFLDLSERIGIFLEVKRRRSSLALSSRALPFQVVTKDVDGFETIEKAWQARHEHSIYKWLDENGNFRKARSTFRLRQGKARSEKLKAPTAEFVFMRLVVENVDLFLRRDHCALRPRGTIKPLRISAHRLAGKLLQLLERGLGLSSYAQQQELERNVRPIVAIPPTEPLWLPRARVSTNIAEVQGEAHVAESLLSGVLGGEEEEKAASARVGPEDFSAALAANLANQSAEVAAGTVAFLRQQTTVLRVQEKTHRAEHEFSSLLQLSLLEEI